MDQEILQGIIAAVVYQNYDNGYSVIRLNCDNGQTYTVVGTIPLPAPGERLMVTGHWTTHANYGKQFEAEFLERLLPATTPQILQYLSGRVIKGIGPKIAGRIVERFGEQTLVIMERQPEKLAQVTGISLAKAKQIGEEFRLQSGIRHLMEFFAAHQLPAELAIKTYKLYGESAIEVLLDEPYLLTEEELDAPFATVDKFAIELGVYADDPRRVGAGLIFELRYNLNAGHSFLPEDKLITITAQMLNISQDAVREVADSLVAGEQLVRDHLADISIIYLPALYQAELYCKRRLLEFSANAYPAPANLNRMVENASNASGLKYSAQQENAIRSAATSGLLLITGGPGTGKTTILNGILDLFAQMGLRCVLAAPTGRASKRLTEVTGEDASTIHRLLEVGIDTHTGKMFFIHDEDNLLKADAVIVDEMSMVDITLLSDLLRAVPHRARLILVGDPDQLPPVGPGFPFGDMLRSGCMPAVRLTEIFRQAQESLIVMNAHKVINGQQPQLRDVKHDFFFLEAKREEDVGQTIVGLCSTRLPKNMNIPPEQIQVLTPTKKGYAGTVYLNKLLQASLNPPSPEKKERIFGDFIFREGDRVMQIRNNYDIMWKKADGSAVGTGVFNGDVGIITEINHTMEQVTVMFDDRVADYEFSQLGELETAYAMTVHKSQGSEYRAVVLAAWSGSQYLLNRSILYTAITRARELLIIVGQEPTIHYMVDNQRISRRYSGLKLRLQGKDAECSD